MSKKSKRQTRKISSSPAPAVERVSTPTSAAAPRTPFATAGARIYDREFTPDYTTVVKDLKRVGILASSFVVILIVLSFFLR